MSLALTPLLPETANADQAVTSPLFQINSQAGTVHQLDAHWRCFFRQNTFCPAKALGNLLLRCRLNGGDWISLDTSGGHADGTFIRPDGIRVDSLVQWTASFECLHKICRGQRSCNLDS